MNNHGNVFATRNKRTALPLGVASVFRWPMNDDSQAIMFGHELAYPQSDDHPRMLSPQHYGPQTVAMICFQEDFFLRRFSLQSTVCDGTCL